jgi:hypothetical protein
MPMVAPAAELAPAGELAEALAQAGELAEALAEALAASAKVRLILAEGSPVAQIPTGPYRFHLRNRRIRARQDSTPEQGDGRRP